MKRLVHLALAVLLAFTTGFIGGCSGSGGGGGGGGSSGGAFFFQWAESLSNGVVFTGFVYSCSDSLTEFGWQGCAQAAGNLENESPINETGDISFDFLVNLSGEPVQTMVMFNMTGTMSLAGGGQGCPQTWDVVDGILLYFTLDPANMRVRVAGGSTYQGQATAGECQAPGFAAVYPYIDIWVSLQQGDCPA